MRLTLRTVLAYLDDVLEPSAAREIGEKIAESKEAEALVLRIRDVIRRRRVGAPELAGPGSGPDPNLVADYLENSLPPAQVVELERLCQKSDVHLAEVAACHKILTMVMSQPMDASDAMRERMYALGLDRSPPPPEGEIDGAAMSHDLQAPSGHALKNGLPEYLTQRSFWQRYAWVVVTLALAVVWLALVVSDRSLWNAGPLLARSEGEVTAEPVAHVEAGAPALAAAAPPRDGQLATAPQPTPDPRPTVASPSPPSDLELLPGGQTSAPIAPLAPPMSDRTTPDSIETPAADLAKVPVQSEPALEIVNVDGVLLKRFPAESAWRVLDTAAGTLATGGSIRVGDDVGCPAPFRAQFLLSDQLQIFIEPGTRIQRGAATDEAALALTLDRGRLIVVRPDTQTEDVALQVTVAGERWTVTLLEPATRIGVEVIPPLPLGPPGATGPLQTGGGVIVVDGRIRAERGGQSPRELAATAGYAAWTLSARDLVVQPDLAAPLWTLPDGMFITAAAKTLARQYQKEFQLDRTVSQSVGPLVRNRMAGLSELAVETLSLTDQYQELVPALASEHQESRLAAIRGLRQWLPRGADHDQLLLAELERSFRSEFVQTLERLLWGYRADDLRDETTSRSLLSWMQSDEVAVRELAFFYVSQLTGRRYDYLPMAPVMERRAAGQRWEDYLKRTGGSLLPK